KIPRTRLMICSPKQRIMVSSSNETIPSARNSAKKKLSRMQTSFFNGKGGRYAALRHPPSQRRDLSVLGAVAAEGSQRQTRALAGEPGVNPSNRFLVGEVVAD